MKLLANENIGRTVVESLRAQGHDVLWAGEALRAASDDVVLSRAERDRRVLITKDKDFGELAFRRRRAHAGIVVLRLRDDAPENTNRVLLRALQALTTAADVGAFVVATEEGVRVRRPIQ